MEVYGPAKIETITKRLNYMFGSEVYLIFGEKILRREDIIEDQYIQDGGLIHIAFTRGV